MASFVWGRDPQEAYRNPYEWDANRQFSIEARTILENFFADLMKKNMCFEKSETSLNKAEWMLLTDATDSLIEALENLDKSRHRITSRLFRDVIENLDLLTYFRAETHQSQKDLRKWFKGEFIPHRVSREYMRETDGESARKQRAKYYQDLSAFTHRTYKALCDSYALGQGDKLVYDTVTESRMMVLPQTLSAYYCVLSDLIIQLSTSLQQSEFVSTEQLASYWSEVVETGSVPRRFVQI
ncbi:hypothetical protein [Vibrio aestuarianus]|uniref:hypothetical protein n=1 Tax=Vibrio aestuarianus TaxID=28171 RepID=UPI001592C6F3|nr:hypothetical protein [Vibrio aestuarianus]MDE1236837.1 hypothetical protein [Vibrio aestuarianus]MDE1247773.1 hypothetical protein [Vibrio aestuarianus]NGZ64904.1 hypothetical protein [Vibrio aestuarianus subsp. cardii]